MRLSFEEAERSCDLCLYQGAFGFTGQYTDNESNMLYVRGRYYDPTSQQFLSRDPAVESTGQPYGYARGNPTNVVDPSGLEGIGPYTQIPPEPIQGTFNLLGKVGADVNAAGAEGNLIQALPSGNLFNNAAPQDHPLTVAPSQGRTPRARAGQRALQELWPGGKSESFATPDEGRNVDWVTRSGDRIYAHESSMGTKPIYGNQHKLNEVRKDAWLMRNVPGYTPLWHFWDAPPAGRLLRALKANGIPFIVYHP